MSSNEHTRDHLEPVCLYALQALPPGEASAVEAQISACRDCRQELQRLRPVIDAFVDWPTDVLRPSTTLWERLSRRISSELGETPVVAPPRPPQPEWEEAAPGMSCKLLSMDSDKGLVSMLFRLAPGAEYPYTPFRVNEWHMLHGEVLVNGEKLHAGDYLRSEHCTSDQQVWTETGCTGVLITCI